MKYHAIPAPRRLTKDIDMHVRHAVNQLKHELISILDKLSRKGSLNYPTLFYLHDHASMSDLMHRLVDGDELIIHAEGCPFIIGPVESGPYTLTPFQLALLLNDNKLPDLDINIHLLSCNSATDYHGNNYSSDISKALNLFFRYQHISVTGYTGFIEVKSNAKLSVSSVLGRSTKGTHSDLDDAKIVYRNGEICFRNKTLIRSLSMMGFAWAEPYIDQTNRERRVIEVLQQASHSKEAAIVRRVASQDTLFRKHGKDKQTEYRLNKSNSHPFFPSAKCQPTSLSCLDTEPPSLEPVFDRF